MTGCTSGARQRLAAGPGLVPAKAPEKGGNSEIGLACFDKQDDRPASHANRQTSVCPWCEACVWLRASGW